MDLTEHLQIKNLTVHDSILLSAPDQLKILFNLAFWFISDQLHRLWYQSCSLLRSSFDPE